MKPDLDEVKEAKEILKNMDPEMVVMAISQSAVNRDEIDKIKNFLKDRDPQAVQYALAEFNQEVLTREVQQTQKKLAKFNMESVRVAVKELGFVEKLGLCADSIGPCGMCIVVMLVRCGQDMYARIVDPNIRINPAAQRARAQAELMGEM